MYKMNNIPGKEKKNNQLKFGLKSMVNVNY